MHLVIVSSDLHRFAHVHPTAERGAFVLRHTFAEGGEYLLVVDYQQPGHGQVVDHHRVDIEGSARAPMPLLETPGKQRADGLELTLRTESALVAGRSVTLHFDAMDVETGAPVADFEPYLGARAHFLVLSADGQDFVHVHASEGGAASSVSAHAVFPRPGLYKLWAEMQRRGVVVTIPFVLRVGSGGRILDPSAAHKPAGGHAHDH